MASGVLANSVPLVLSIAILPYLFVIILPRYYGRVELDYFLIRWRVFCFSLRDLSVFFKLNVGEFIDIPNLFVSASDAGGEVCKQRFVI